MKVIELKDTHDLHELFNEAQSEDILVTREGEPFVVIAAADGDQEIEELRRSPEFWAMVRKWRTEPTIPWEDVGAELLAVDE